MAASQQNIKVESGLFESIKENLNPSHLMKKFNITSDTLIKMALYFGGGIIIGYMLKKYGKFVIMLILCVLGLLLLQQIGIITITLHADKVQEIFGLQSSSLDEKKPFGELLGMGESKRCTSSQLIYWFFAWLAHWLKKE